LKHGRNKTIALAALATLGSGALLTACGGQSDNTGEQKPAYAVPTNLSTFDVSDPSGSASIELPDWQWVLPPYGCLRTSRSARAARS